jgi:hypothetical protein
MRACRYVVVGAYGGGTDLGAIGVGVLGQDLWG